MEDEKEEGRKEACSLSWGSRGQRLQRPKAWADRLPNSNGLTGLRGLNETLLLPKRPAGVATCPGSARGRLADAENLGRPARVWGGGRQHWGP